MKKNAILKRVKCSLLMLGLLFLSLNIHAKEEVSMSRTTEYPGSNSTQQNVKKVSGIVEDKDGLSIIGASVLIKGTTKGTITDIDGKYDIDVPDGSTLVFSYIGFVKQEVAVASQQTINVVMLEDSKALEEVVVMGYGSTRKQDLSMAVSTIKIDDSMRSSPSNINSLMQGRMPGVTLQIGGGDPLGEATLSIRGRGSRGKDSNLSARSSEGINNNANSGDGVLTVVDGVPNAPYNVEDIETITVLKDAASAAIYGASVGSGGVIIITTKQAQTGKTRVTVNISYSMKKAKNLPSVLRADQYNKVWGDVVRYDNEAGGTLQLPSVADPTKYAYGAVTRTDWLDEIFRTGQLQHYALSVSGGSETFRSFFSMSYDRDEGILRNTYSDKIGGKINLDYNITKWMTFSQRGTFKYSNGQGDVGRTHQAPLIGAVFYPRSATVYEYAEDDTPVLDQYGKQLYGGTIPLWATSSVSGFGTLRNPVAALDRLRQHRPAFTLYSTSSLEVKPMRGLSVKSDFTAGWKAGRYEQFNSRITEYGDLVDDNARFIASTWNTNWLWETVATYAIEIADKHNVSAMAGYSLSKENYRWNDAWTNNFTNEDKHEAIFPGGTDWKKNRPLEVIRDEQMESAFGRLAYSFDDRYFVTGSIRRDATSKLLKKNNSGTFPAVSASWKLSSEPFFKGMKDYIDLFKIRGSWGQVGSVKLVPYNAFNPTLGVDGKAIIYGEDLNNPVYGVFQETILNKGLTWETTDQTGFGLDVTMLDKSLDLTVDYFHKTTQDLIEKVRAIGIKQKPYGNISKSINKGWEFGVSYNKKIDKLSFTVYANLATVKSEVRNLGMYSHMNHEESINSNNPLRSAPGQPWYSYYLVKTNGIFQNQEEISKYLYKDAVTGEAKQIQPNAKPGDIRFVDTNGDGQINDNDRQFMGSFLPKKTYAFGANLYFKEFDFSFMFQGVAGNKIYNGFKQMGLNGRMQGSNMLSEITKSWEYDKNSGYPRLSIGSDPNGNYGMSSFFLESGSYLRLKNVTVGYTLPKKIMQTMSMPASSIRFYGNIENLLTITPYSGIDPEVGYFGLDGSTYPVPISFTLGFNFNF